ncbi:MAG: precorrin-4 C(11)-methyltransferase [Oligoflexia bacterium]|nr:precorrin-4 C(11)-methyltransferase [Oligoflexia bacterium]
MKVFFIGAGPGDPELITIKAAKTIAKCEVIIYAGSLVSEEIIKNYAQKDALVFNSATMTLKDIIAVIVEANKNNQSVARIHTGDPSIYGSIAEQIRDLNELNIAWEVIPGVSSFQAAAATLGQELTLPELSQTIIITRVEGRTPMPSSEKLNILAKAKATMVFFLSSNIELVKSIVRELTPFYGSDCPSWVVYRASWPDQKILKTNLKNLEQEMSKSSINLQSIIFVGEVLGKCDFENSKLYSEQFAHLYRDIEK